jgi:hypothetical protein
MKKIAVTGIAALAAVAGATTVTYIDANRGGNVLSFVAYYDQAAARGEQIIIRGDCASSCTMGLGYKNVCLLPSASLRFHPAYTPILFGLFSYVLNPSANHVMLSHYPPDARAVIDRHGDLTKDPGGWWWPNLFTIKATEFPQHLCQGRLTSNT